MYCGTLPSVRLYDDHCMIDGHFLVSSRKRSKCHVHLIESALNLARKIFFPYRIQYMQHNLIYYLIFFISRATEKLRLFGKSIYSICYRRIEDYCKPREIEIVQDTATSVIKSRGHLAYIHRHQPRTCQSMLSVHMVRNIIFPRLLRSILLSVPAGTGRWALIDVATGEQNGIGRENLISAAGARSNVPRIEYVILQYGARNRANRDILAMQKYISGYCFSRFVAKLISHVSCATHLNVHVMHLAYIFHM